MVYFSVGLDAAGKTTILYKLKLGEIVTTIPTIGRSALAGKYIFTKRVGKVKVLGSMSNISTLKQILVTYDILFSVENSWQLD